MSENIGTLRTLAVVIAAAMLLPSAVGAQVRSKSAPPPPAYMAVERQAKVLLDQPKKWAEAAALLEQAAALRAPDDITAVGDLMTAAGARRWSGDRAAARAVYVQAGERALSLGDVERAARAFLYAALIANEQKDVPAAIALKTRAERLARSPLLSPEQRDIILGQFSEQKRYAEH